MNNFWKSFRYKIMLYSLFSLILALVTEVVLFTGIFFVADLFKKDGLKAPVKQIVEQSIEENSTKDSGEKKSTKEKDENKETEGKENKGKEDKEAGTETEDVITKESREEEISELSPMENVANEVIVATGSRKRFFELNRRIQKFLYLFIVAAVTIYIGIFLAYFHMFTHKTSDYLAEISDGIDEIAKGDFHKSVRVMGEDEIANIAEKINNMTKEIQILIENEREYEKEKSDLITNVAHDLRTPLTSIIGYLDLVKRKSELGNEDRDKYITIAYDKSKRLEKLIGDLFEFTKVGAERVQIHPVDLDFKKFMEQMVEEFYPSFEDVNLECMVQDNLKEGRLTADPDLLARGIANLFSNAVKYGKDGKVIKVRLREDRENIYLNLTNYGEIIPEEDLGHIFDKFFRVENSRSEETGGTGLGLAIAKKVIHLHHGKIQVSSDYKGTVFAISLPKDMGEA